MAIATTTTLDTSFLVDNFRLQERPESTTIGITRLTILLLMAVRKRPITTDLLLQLLFDLEPVYFNNSTSAYINRESNFHRWAENRFYDSFFVFYTLLNEVAGDSTQKIYLKYTHGCLRDNKDRFIKKAEKKVRGYRHFVLNPEAGSFDTTYNNTDRVDNRIIQLCNYLDKLNDTKFSDWAYSNYAKYSN